jgi:malate dehydrogenase (oxaloacetate-decarboxylating)(NADP+)
LTINGLNGTDDAISEASMSSNFTPSQKTVIRKEDALEYHSRERRGKIEVVPTKPCSTARELSLAYTPGVAEPCLEIARDENLSYTYTARGNLVAVITNGTAVLGLGDIGPSGAKPVMEGKGVLFKKFADIDVFDIELNANDVDTFCNTVRTLEPTFGGINLEDIKAPECFVIEERLKRELKIPVFHDDQHGTAIISGAALINAVEIAGKKMDKLRVVVAGAGAAAIATSKFYVSLGVKQENIMLVDTKGVLYKGRTEGINEFKEPYLVDTRCRTLADAMEGADMFLGCASKGLVTPRMIQSMAKNPIVFALANPDPEITYPEAKAARSDIIMATGRSDYPNQVNNVLGFPFIFRGALDVRATAINEEMKMAAARALAMLAREEVPDAVSLAYGGEHFKLGPDYLIPKPFDSRVLLWVAPAVAKAAMETGVARVKIDLKQYREELKKRQSRTQEVMGVIFNKAKKKLARIAFTDGEHPRILQAAQMLREDGICEPILLGRIEEIGKLIEEQHLTGLKGITIIEPRDSEHFEAYAKRYVELRGRKGVTVRLARERMRGPRYFGTMLLHEGGCDGLLTGLTENYPEAIRAPLEIIKAREGRRAGGVYIVVLKNGFKFFADCTVNIEPSSEEMAEIAVHTADLARFFDVTPRVAMLSYSNFGSASGPSPAKVREAVKLARKKQPDLEIDGEMEVDLAMLREERSEFPFTKLTDEANVFVFPNLDAANIGYKLLWRLAGAEVIGPVLLGMNKPVNVLQMHSDVQNIVSLAAVTALRAQSEEFPF